MESYDFFSKKKRIAVIVPVEYKGGSLRGAKLLANALLEGSRQAGEHAEVVFCHLDASLYSDEDFFDIDSSIKIRRFSWRILEAGEARRAMRYSGFVNWEPDFASYQIVDDGIRQLQDCDVWIVISDRLEHPMLPQKPVVLNVYDYLQRYVSIISNDIDAPFIRAARCADRVWVTTNFTYSDALQYACISPKKLRKLPMLAPDFYDLSSAPLPPLADCFLWTTNLALHKNHENAIKALDLYYREFGGELKCKISGVGTNRLLDSPPVHLQNIASFIKNDEFLSGNLLWQGEVSNREYVNLLMESSFLWHPGKIDNGTFSVIEAASKGVPSLSSDYPAMREIDLQFNLNLIFCDPNDPFLMAEKLKFMELHYLELRSKLPSREKFQEQSMKALARFYWNEVKGIL